MELFDAKDIPELNPPVMKILMKYLRKEVAAYDWRAHGKKCLLCPFPNK